MAIVFLLFIPSAAFIARHYKHVFPETWFLVLIKGGIGWIEGSSKFVHGTTFLPTGSPVAGCGICPPSATCCDIHPCPHTWNLLSGWSLCRQHAYTHVLASTHDLIISHVRVYTSPSHRACTRSVVEYVYLRALCSYCWGFSDQPKALLSSEYMYFA